MLSEIVQYEVDVGSITVFILIFAIIITLVGLLFQLFLAVLIYRDANDNNDPNAFLWGVVVFFTGIIGIIVYLLVKSRSPMKQYDPSREIPLRRTSATRFCPYCGTIVEKTSKFCMDCGAKL
ncbi:MAG: zinc-ribbon domain-containing protein [Candidatus Hodarchaeales archaeon]